MKVRYSCVVGVLAVLTAACFPSYADLTNDIIVIDTRYVETRYIDGSILRDKNGNIVRDPKVVEAFKKLHPKPPADLLGYPCDVWEVDHVISLACGGKDEVSNMQWLPTCLKRTKKYGKDHWELKIYGGFVEDSICKKPGE